jgi:hypothetical protein
MNIPEYAKRLTLAFERHPELFPRGELSFPSIQHDDWCHLLVQGGQCDCKPDVYVEVKGQRYSVNPDGSVALVSKP